MLIGSWGRVRAWHVLQDGDDRTERPGPRGTATRRLEPFVKQRGDGMTVTVTRVGGRYRLGPSLGVGGMGRVWLARDEILQREVAIKEVALPAGLAEDEREELRLRTLREARAAARVNHPNVVQIYDVIPGEDQPWIVMEYVRARSLMEIITEYGPLPVDQVARIGIGMLSALEAANRAGVLHRDVKPSNVLIAHDGRRSEEHTSELQSQSNLVCRLLLEKK